MQDGTRHRQVASTTRNTALVAGLLVATSARRRLSSTAWPWMWLAWLASTSSVVYAYVVSPAPLVWHVGTSADRKTIAPRMLLLAESVIWASAAVAALRQDDARPPTVTAWSARESSSLSPELSP
ncbi:MAG TPA: hypothetical protein VKE97_01015 [Acidimicrobiia bacterium]|nr:hypothetical protein [Acidimicrobiia bacterium]